MEELIEEVQEARRIRLKHQPNKVMDMEHEVQALRIQSREKNTVAFNLQRELALKKKAEENKLQQQNINGSETLGSILRIQGCSDDAIELSKCSIQWFRLSYKCSKREPIVGADKGSYARSQSMLEDGRVLEVDILFNGQKVSVITAGPINLASGLESYADTLSRKENFEFSVFVSQMNGKTILHILHIHSMSVKRG